jgi:hypothetical protein
MQDRLEAFVEQLDLREMGFESVDPEATATGHADESRRAIQLHCVWQEKQSSRADPEHSGDE